MELATIQVTVRADTGKVEVRSKGSAKWRTVGKNGSAAGFGRRGALAHRHGVPGAWRARRRRSRWLRAVSWWWTGAGKQGSTDEARVDLRQGEMTLRLASERDSRVVMPGLTLESEGAAHLNVKRTVKGFDVAARAGDVVLVRGDSRQPLRAGEQASLAGEADAIVAPLVKAPLALPADG